MFDKDFYPTPPEVIERMLAGYEVAGKHILEPSAGKGNIVDFCIGSGAANVIACEKNPDLRKIVSSKCKVIADDFLTVKSEDISHINMIVMNPPFSADEKHIIHAFNIAPAGCDIISLCNANTYSNYSYRSRLELRTLIDNHGSFVDLGKEFAHAERKTDVDIGLVTLKKPGESYASKFEGFFLEDDPEEQQFNGLMPYNFVRDLVNRYIGAVRIFDDQLDAAVRMNQLTSQFYSSNISMSIKQDEQPLKRNQFKKDLQKQAWMYIFNKMNMQKYATKGLKEDINKFVEQQTNVPFTMRNIYRMLEIVVGTHEQRMDKAILEVFDRLTERYHENRYNVEGWKTNSHYLMGQKFILPGIASPSWGRGVNIEWHRWYGELMQDLIKAMCYLTGEPYDDVNDDEGNVIRRGMSRPLNGYNNLEPNTWYEWGFFEFKVFKKGTGHFKFKNIDHWAMLNQRIAKLKGYPLFEARKAGR